MFAIRIFICYTIFGVLTSAINHVGYISMLKHKDDEATKDLLVHAPWLLDYAEERVYNGPGLRLVLLEIFVWPYSWVRAFLAARSIGKDKSS